MQEYSYQYTKKEKKVDQEKFEHSEQLLKIQDERKAIKMYFDIVKTLALVIGSVILFFSIRKPESLINREMTEETIARERAKLILELIKIPNPSTIALGLSVIKDSYPKDESEWFNKLEKTFNLEASTTDVENLRIKYNELSIQIDSTSSLLKAEIDGYTKSDTTGKQGFGPQARRISLMLETLIFERDLIEDQLKNSYNIESLNFI